MNQMDENYWKQLAQDWIRKQSQSSDDLLPKELQIPEAPKISFSDNTNYDNLAVADMEIEDVKEEPVQAIWNSIHNPATTTIAFSNIQQTPFVQVPVQQQFPTSSSRFQKQQDAPRKSHFTPQQPLIIPDPPSINNIEDQINTIDMDMDDSDNDDSNSNSASSVSMMDIQRRKKLPIWIREGLEKMKREKELEEARLREEQKRKEDEENRKKLMEEALKEIEKEKVSKSKYESSDSENDETDDNKVPQNQQKFEPIENDEEAYEKMMLLVRKTLTSLLLEVTDEKIQEISNETLSKYRKKASATTKPALIGLGLGAYSSSTDEEDSDNENGGTNSDWESESILKERIHQKQIIFERCVKERIEKQTAEEEERLKRRSSSSKSEPEQVKHAKMIRHSDSDDDRQKFKSSRKDGEEKYETMIYSISTSSGPIMRVPREKKTRFSDPKDGRSTNQMTHLGMVDSTRSTNDNGTNLTPKIVVPLPPPIVESPTASDSPKKKKKRRNSSTSSSSSDSGHRKKHKKHKKSSKHSKKSSKKKDKSRSRSRSRDKEKRHHSSKSDRRSIESKSSIRSSESSRRRTRSRSRSRDRHRRRY